MDPEKNSKIEEKEVNSIQIPKNEYDGIIENFLYMNIHKIDQNSVINQNFYSTEMIDTNMKIDVENNVDEKFFALTCGSFMETFNNWNDNIKSLKINENGFVAEKLNFNDLILTKCKEISLEKILNYKEANCNIDEIMKILSYNNIDPNILYFCFSKIKQNGNINHWIHKYRYCFCDKMSIVDYSNNNNINEIDLNKLFNYKFPFSDIQNGIDTLKAVIDDLIILAFEFYKFRIYNSNITIEFEYEYNETKNIIETKNQNNELINLGLKFLQNCYLKIKDFDKFESNQPLVYNNNNILYIAFCINEIYKFLVNCEDKKIIIDKNYFRLVRNLIPILNSLKDDLNQKNFDNEFHHKIRFFNIAFESSNINYTGDFMKHIFKEKDLLDSKDIKNFIEQRKAKMKIADKIDEKNGILSIYLSENEITKYNLREYNKDFIESILSKEYDCKHLEYTWENNSLKAFQTHNFLLPEDILLLKEVIKEIFSSKFWKEICDLYCDNYFIDIYNVFQNEDFINQFFERLIFFPFNIDDFGFFAFTTNDDLYIFISGYPYTNKKIYHSNYTQYRIIQLGISVIVIIHETIHYLKRLLYFITCGMIYRTTIIDYKREEGGDMLEKIIFGLENDKEKKDRKVNIILALNLLNSKVYEYDIQNAKNIFTSGKILEERSKNLNDYLSKIDLLDPNKFSEFIKRNKNLTMNASRECFSGDLEIEYPSIYSDHNRFKSRK